MWCAAMLSPQHLSAWRRATRAGLLKLPADVEMPAGSGMNSMRRARRDILQHIVLVFAT
jgi:hypothetical protein